MLPTQNFSDFSLFWKSLIIIGSISTFIFIILLVIVIFLMIESNNQKKIDNDLNNNYDDFLNEFINGKSEESQKSEESEESEESEKIMDYPVLPKIRDFDGKILRNLMQIDIIS